LQSRSIGTGFGRLMPVDAKYRFRSGTPLLPPHLFPWNSTHAVETG